MNGSVPEDARLEIKFTTSTTNYHALLQWLRLHPACFVSPFPQRWINNFYTDTHTYTAFADNLSGASNRTKVRYRWYGRTRAPDAGTLEVKCKRNCFGWKKYFPITDAPYAPGYTWRKIYQDLAAQLDPEGNKWLAANPLPVLINRYYRQYFVSADDLVRVTIDTRQGVWDQRFKPYPNFTTKANLPDCLIVEFKFDRKDYDLASLCLEGMPVRVSRISKYVTGARAISGF